VKNLWQRSCPPADSFFLPISKTFSEKNPYLCRKKKIMRRNCTANKYKNGTIFSIGNYHCAIGNDNCSLIIAELPIDCDYGFRNYDKKQRRFTSIDPLTAKYPWYTPYQFAGNKVIQAVDLDGAEELRVTLMGKDVQYRNVITNLLLKDFTPQIKENIESGKELLKSLEKGPSDRDILVWLNFSHGGEQSIFAAGNQSNGLSFYLEENLLMASFGDLVAKMQNENISFIEGGLIILGNCNTGKKGFATRLAKITGMYVIASTGPFTPTKKEANYSGMVYTSDVGKFVKFFPDGKTFEVIGDKLDIVKVINETVTDYLRNRAGYPVDFQNLGIQPRVDEPGISPEFTKPIER
jgi:hypothetical protein